MSDVLLKYHRAAEQSSIPPPLVHISASPCHLKSCQWPCDIQARIPASRMLNSTMLKHRVASSGWQEGRKGWGHLQDLRGAETIAEAVWLWSFLGHRQVFAAVLNETLIDKL